MIRTDLIAPIGELLSCQVQRRPGKLAFRDKVRSVTYQALATRTAMIAGYLQQAGVEPGQRVAIHLPNSVDWVEMCVAIVRAGAVAVPISFASTADEIAYRLSDAQCVVVFTYPERVEELHALCTAHAIDPKVIAVQRGEGKPFASSAAMPLPAPRDPVDIAQPAFIVYTSGTTGKAKGVVLTLEGMLWVTAACWVPIAGLSENDYVLDALPLFHSYALNLAVVSIIATGASEYIMEQFSTSEMAKQLRQQPVTVLPGVPTFFHYMLERSREEKRRTLNKLRICLSAGAILPGTLNRDFENWFGIKLLDGYGITETSTMVTLNSPEGSRFMGSCGVPLPGLGVRIVDLEGKDLDPGQDGELIVRGPNVMLGYHGKPDETASALRNGWYHTGDLARRDRFGFITITGRLKEIIIRGGQNISPAEVEETLSLHTSILDCAVVGLPHEFLGEVPVAFIIPRPGRNADTAEILEHCRLHLSDYKVPHAIHVVAEIPRTGSGKVQRFKLKELVQAPRF
ncbi:MAG: AMP-binding protein [Rhodomicrobium sp.]